MDVLEFVRSAGSTQASPARADEAARSLTSASATLPQELAQQLSTLDFEALGLGRTSDLTPFIDAASRCVLGPEIFDRFYLRLLARPLHPALGRDYITEAVLHFALCQRDFPAASLSAKRPLYVHVGNDVSPFLATVSRGMNLGGAFYPGSDLRGQGEFKLDLELSEREGWISNQPPETLFSLDPHPEIVLVALGDLGDPEEIASTLDVLLPLCAAGALLVVNDRADIVQESSKRIVEAAPSAEVALHIDEATERAILASRSFDPEQTVGSSGVAQLPSIRLRAHSSRSSRAFPIRMTDDNLRVDDLSSHGTREDSFAILRESRNFALPSPNAIGGPPPLSKPDEEFLHQPRMRAKAQTCGIYHSCHATGSGVVITSDHRLAEESLMPLTGKHESTFWAQELNVATQGPERFVPFYDGSILVEGSGGTFHTTSEPSPNRYMEGPTVLLGGLYSHVLGHWIYDILSKAWAVPELERRGLERFRCVFPGPLKPKQIEMIEMAGIPEHQIVQLGIKEWAQFEQLYVPSRPTRMYDYIVPEVFEMYERFITASNIQSFDTPKRFYISRPGASDRRALLNEDAVIEVVTAFGFEPLVFDHMSLQEEIATFANAEAVISPMGSGMASMCFMSPESSVLCLTTHDKPRVVRHHQTICAHKRIDLRVLFGHSFRSRSDIAHWVIDAERLRDMVDQMLRDRKEA